MAAGSSPRKVCAIQKICRFLATIFLSLLLPLSLLLLARFSIARYSFLSLFSLVSFTILGSFIHNICCCKRIYTNIHVAWILLCSMQFFASVGVYGGVDAGFNGDFYYKEEINIWQRVIFALGCYEAMKFWYRAIVKLVVDVTIIGYFDHDESSCSWMIKLIFGLLWWWWRLNEVGEAMTVAAMGGLHENNSMDYAVRWLYGLIVMNGIVIVVKCFVFLYFVGVFLYGVLMKKFLNGGDSSENDHIEEESIV